jgi:hypothetical protein
VVFNTLFTLCPFETKRKSIIFFWIGIIFLNQSRDFCSEWPKEGFVSFIGFILLTKSLSCNVAVLTGIPFILEFSKYSKFIYLIWKEPYYDKFQCRKLQEGNFRVP